MTEFDPHDLRRAFGSFITGVTVVTTRDAAGTPVGFTANSFASVSLDPPLLLVCPGKSLSCYGAFSSSASFAVNVLAEGQQRISNTFASFKGDRFAEVAHHFNADSIPLIDGALAQFSCATHQVIDAGDHCLLLGRVEAFSYQSGIGLAYAGGRYLCPNSQSRSSNDQAKQVTFGALIDIGGRVLLRKSENGFEPPKVTRTVRKHLREDLTDALALDGVEAHLGAVYSIFDDANGQSSYVLATAARTSAQADFVAVDIQDLRHLSYTSQPIAKMMARYALEAELRDFKLYLGDAQSGEMHNLFERT